MLLHILVLSFVSCTLEGSGYHNKPFPNYLSPLSQNEYVHNLSYGNEFD